MHSDNLIVEKSKNLFEFEPTGTSLLAKIMSPKYFTTVIEKNILTAPGRPRSVDKGEREERGVRLAINNQKATNAKFKIKLTVKK